MEHFFYGSLHNHTEYSNLRLRDCIIKGEDLINYAIELGHEVVGITDHEAVCNAVKIEKIYKKVKEKNPNFKVILGNEIYLVRNGLNAENFNKDFDRYYHFILLAKDAIGHQQIREISTRAWGRSYMARGMRRVPTYYQDLFDVIGKNPGHVIGSTACLGGALATQLLKYNQTKDEELYGKIIKWADLMEGIFGADNFFLELQPSDSKEQSIANRMLIDLANNFHYNYIITTDSHYLKKEDASIHKAFLNAQDGDREVDSFYATTYMMDTEELESHLFLSREELQEAYHNIKKIKDMCEDYSLLKSLKIPQLMWKDLGSYTIDQRKWWNRIPYLNDFWNSEYEGDQELADTICLRLEQDARLQNQETYDAVNECLRMTWVSSEKNKTHWSAYFLNLQKIIEECWNAGTLVGCGRGSGVGFILLYLLGITQINPLWESTQTFPWRFLNPDRVSVLDVDVDIESSKRGQVLAHLRKVYGSDRVANVATFRQEKSKSAIQTACRGLGIDVDVAQYLSGMIVAERGITRTLKQTFYGDEEAGINPSKQFVIEMTENYPQVWEVAQKIEGLVCGYGTHAGGVIFVDEPFTNSTALMRAPDGTIETAFDLHDCEDVSLIKYDLLSVDALDKIHICLNLLIDDGRIDKSQSLKQIYEDTIGIYNLEREAAEMWKMVWEHKISSLFQMEQQSGIQGIALTHPQSVDDLAVLNSVIRLMAQEKGAEQPLNKFARFKRNISFWYDEMTQYGLTDDEQKILEPIVKLSYGICESQEKFMQLVQMPECGGFDLTWADSLRKAIAKKNPAGFEKLEKEFFENMKSKNLSKTLCNYVWKVLVSTSKGYGFNASHTLAYSLIALQEMNLAYKFPVIYWNCACLISDSGGLEGEEADHEFDEETGGEIVWNSASELSMVDFSNDNEEEPDDDEDEDDEDGSASKTEKKKKTKATNYGKIASAIGKMISEGISVIPPDINKSGFTFTPDVESNAIRYGFRGITRISEELIKTIINNRPYESFDDFSARVKMNKPQTINLIKAGAFDTFEDRIELMTRYIDSIADKKNAINLRNLQMLITNDMLPDKFEEQIRYFNFNKYLKKLKITDFYALDNIAMNAIDKYCDVDVLVPSDESESGFLLPIKEWDKIWKKQQGILRPYIKAHEQEYIEQVNKKAFNEMWDKYATGNISKWEMDAISYYYHPHELKNVNHRLYQFRDFNKLSDNPEVEEMLMIKGKQIPLFRISRIAGTILDKDKNKKTLTLLTTTGVVNVKIFGDVFTHYDRQISEVGADGKKHVIEKSFLARGNKIIVCGIRRDNMFIAKKYKRTPHHLVELITSIDEEGRIRTRGERMEA